MKEVADNPDHLKKVLAVMAQQGPIRTIEEVSAKFSEYAVLGYSGAGIVAAAHSTVTDLAIGARVAYGGEGTGHGELVVTGRQLVAPIPDAVSDEDAAFTTLGAIAMNTVRTGDIALGETVVVLGLGLVGQLTAQLARLAGARVIAIDLLPSRVSLAEQLGAEAGVRGADGALEDVLRLTHGRGADCVIIAAAAKSAAPARAALSMVRDRGRIVIVGAVGVEFPWLPMYLKEVEVRMARAYGPGSYDPVYEQRGQDYPLPYVRWTENRNMVEFLRLLSAGTVTVAPLISHRFALERAPEAYATILDSAISSLAVVLSYPATTPAATSRRMCLSIACNSGLPSRRGGFALRWLALATLCAGHTCQPSVPSRTLRSTPWCLAVVPEPRAMRAAMVLRTAPPITTRYWQILPST